MASDLSSGCTETIDIFDEKEEGEISLEDVSSSEEGGIGHLTCGYVIRPRRSCSSCKSTWGECASWCTANSKAYNSKGHSRKDPVKGKENRHHVNEGGCAMARHTAMSTLQEKNDDDLLPISSDSDMEIVGLTDTSKQLASRPKVRLKKKKKKKDYECFTIDDLISPSSIDLTSVVEHFTESRETSSAKGTSLSSRSYYRESSPIRRSGRSRMISKSPLRRYRSPVPPEKSRDMRARSSFQSRSRSPPLQKRLSRRLRSPKRSRSPYASPVRTRKLQRLRSSSPPPARSCVDHYGDVTKQLLKKVNSVPGIHAPESSANRSKEHQPASLREKLSNMMKKTSDNVHTHCKEKSLAQPKAINDADDEEDLALLRQKALETKQKHKCNKSEHSTEVEPKRKPSTRTNDDQDEEDLQLRMIALRSAVMKKHQNRIRAKNKKTTTIAVNSRSESPFTQSFIENISIPDDQLKSATPSSTPPLSDSNHIEDMDLDTDVEREKEKLSYSPTNKISAAVSIDTELLGIEPSDVSFISLNDNCLNNSPTYAKDCERKPAPLSHANLPHYESSNCFAYVPPSARDDDRVSFHVDSNDNRELPDFIKNLHDDSIECNLIDGTCCQRDIYSSINVPVYVNVESMDLPLSSTASHYMSLAPTQNFTAQQSDCDCLLTHVDLASGGEQSNNIQSNEHACKTVFGYPVTSSPTASALELSPNGSMVTMVTIDYLPETDGDSNSPFIDPFIGNPLPAVDYVSSEEAPCQADEIARESLYVQGVPDITKDINKIPTLINRALVPMAILKSNKQLQQPLPKRETLPKPTFKSAEMQPVIATANTKRNKTNLKPIKLIPLVKKPQAVLTTPVEFNDSVDENLENLTSESISSHETEPRLAADVPAVASNNSITSRKKRKRVRKNREKTLNNKDSLRENSSCTKDIVNKDVNLTTIGTMITQQPQQIAECDQKENNDDSTTRESSMENRELLNSQNITGSQKFLSSIDSSDNKLQNADNINKNDQHVFSNNEESSNYTALSSSSENTQEKKIESNRNIVGCLPTNSDNTSVLHNKTTQVTKDGEKKQNSNRRESVDENEDELRAILLASLVKRTTKSSDTSATSTLVTTSCVTTNTRVSARKAPASATTMLIVNTTAVNNNTPLPSTLNLSEAIESVNNMAAKRTNVLISSLGSNKKKLNLETMAKGSPKKMVKKTSVSANAKVMNNTKCQSTLVQQKSNNQKHDTTAYNDKTKLKQDNVWSANAPKGSAKMHTLETQRIVINLGSDTDSESETERHTADASVLNTVNVNAQDINTDFEKSLHKFLRDVRKEQESAVAFKPALSPQLTKRNTPITQMDPSKAPSSNMHTPLAVRHLPASQQEEYRRLKQQILEREKLKLQRRAINNNNNKGTNSTNNSASSDNKLMINGSGTSLKSLSPYDKESSIAFKQDQVKLRKAEKNDQHSWTEVRENIADMKSTMISSISHASTNKIVSTNIAKQTNSVHLQAKGAKKVVPNIRITAEVENRVIENPVDLASKHQPLSDKQPFRAALRTLSNDEIDRKYVQIQLKQDMTERVVTINDKSSIKRHDTMSDDRGEKSVANDSAIGNSPDVKVINNSSNYNDSFSNASTIVLTNLSANSDAMKLAFADSTMETTISNSEYERKREREINHDMSISLLAESNSHDSNDVSHTSDVNSNDKGNTDTVWNTVRKEPKAELESLEHLSKMEQHRYLSNMENKLVARRYTILDHLAEMSGDLRQWDMEMDLQNNLVVEVRKLKEQLKMVEKRLQAQRNRVSSMGPKISTARQEINAGQRECFELSRICTVLGNRLVGKDYKLPEAGNQLLNDKLKEIANHTRQLSKKKLSSNDSSENSVLPISSSQMSSSPESPKTCVEEDLSLQKQLTNEAAVTINCMMELGSDISRSEQSNNIENSSTIDISQTLPNQVTPARRNQTSAIVWESYGDGQDTPNQDNMLPSEPKLSSTPILIRQDSECTQRTRRKDTAEFAASSEPRLSSPPLYEDNQQQNNKKMQLLPTATTTITTMTTMTTTATTTTTTMTTMTMTTTTMTATVIEPYVSILTHFKTPRNANPNGVLCPYDLMGTCNDGDCQFVHQSTSHI